jgi:predicted nucleic acid-binding OB-fold protein
LQTFLPNIKSASIEEVMEVRYKMKNELEGFRAAMSKLSATIKSHPWGPHIHEEADKIIETQVKPAIHDLTVSLSHSKLQVVQKIFENIKNPAAYIPFLATVNSNIKPAIAALASTGLVGAKVLWDILVERKKLEDTSGLVFLLKAPAKFKRRAELNL